MAQYGTWVGYEGASRTVLALVLLVVAAGVVYAGTRLRRPVRARQPGQRTAYIMLAVWAVSIVAFMSCFVALAQHVKHEHLAHTQPADPIAPITFTAVAAVFGIIAIAGPQDWPARLGGAAIGALAAPMIFELPFDLIVMARTYPPVPPDPALYRVLFFAPLFGVEIMTLSLLTLSPMVRLTRITFFAFAAILVVFAVWALAGFGYPSTAAYYTCNVVSKIGAFVTVLTLFQPRVLWAGARARVGARSGSGTASGADRLLDQGAAEAPD